VKLPKNAPEWARSISNVGLRMAELGSTPVGQLAPRLLLSVPTGQYASWLLANGALQAPIKLSSEPKIGDIVTVWLDKRLQDIEVRLRNEDTWELSIHSSRREGKLGVDRVPGVVVPCDTPKDRGHFQPTPEYRVRMEHVFGPTWPITYEQQCGSPVVVIGDGKEFLRLQRDELVDVAHDWLDAKSAISLDQDTHQVSNPERILFHPFMVFSPEVAKSHVWIRQITPRLVIVTRWSYFRRMDPSLFSGAPMIVIANRRVESNWNAIDETDEKQELGEEFGLLKLPQHPNGIFSRKFVSRVNLPLDDDDEESYI